MSNVTQTNISLTTEDKAIIAIAGFAAAGNIEELTIELNDALNAGVSQEEIKAILAQLYAYCGFPRSLNALGALMKVIEMRKEQGVSEEPQTRETLEQQILSQSLKVGSENQTQLIGREVSGPLFDFCPEIDAYLKAHLFGDIFSKSVVTWRQRELATISALANISGTASQLGSHFRISLNNQVTQNQLVEFITVLKDKFGVKVSANAQQVLDSTLN